MTRVNVVSHNLFAGADLKKLEVGAELDVLEESATLWIKAELVELTEKKAFEVATPTKQKGKGKKDGDNNAE